MNRVLIVDDDEEFGDLLSQMLAGLGYVAVSCNDPSQALSLFEDDPGRFDIVMIDEVMPKTTGIELGGLFLRVRDDVPMVLLRRQGYKTPFGRARSAGFLAALTKPVSKEEIKEILAKIREGAEGTAKAVLN